MQGGIRTYVRTHSSLSLIRIEDQGPQSKPRLEVYPRDGVNWVEEGRQRCATWRLIRGGWTLGNDVILAANFGGEDQDDIVGISLGSIGHEMSFCLKTPTRKVAVGGQMSCLFKTAQP